MQQRPPFDRELSARIDLIILELEDPATSPPRRHWLRLRKRLTEHHIPAFDADLRGAA